MEFWEKITLDKKNYTPNMTPSIDAIVSIK